MPHMTCELAEIVNEIALAIARIDARSGLVRSWIDFSSLASQEQKSPEAVLNGIAFDSVRHRFFITGKNWSRVFETRIEGITF